MSALREKISDHRAIAAFGTLALLLVAGGWLWAFLVLRDRPHSLILHWNDLINVNIKGDMGDLSGLGALSVLAVILNFKLALELDRRDWFLGKLVIGATFGFGVLIFIGFAAIVSVN